MNKGIIYVCMLLLCLACNDSDAGNTLPLSFQTIQMENNSNFVTLTAITDEDLIRMVYSQQELTIDRSKRGMLFRTERNI